MMSGFEPESVTMSKVTDIYKSLESIAKGGIEYNATKEPKKVESFTDIENAKDKKEREKKNEAAILKLRKGVLQLGDTLTELGTGIPTKDIKQYILSGIGVASPKTELEVSKLILPKTKTQVYDTFEKALESGDQKKVKELINNLNELGLTKQGLTSSMKRRLEADDFATLIRNLSLTNQK